MTVMKNFKFNPPVDVARKTGQNITVAIAAAMMVGLTGCAVVSDRETTGQYIDDTTTTTSVKSSIFQDRELKGSQIHVETFQGVVQLSGFVDSYKESLRAGQIAQNIGGVRAVKNNLVVRNKALRR